MTPPQGARRSSRIPKQVAILLIGSDAEGKVFSEDTQTVVLSRHGAGVLSRHKLAAEEEVILRNMESNEEASVRVVGQIGAQWDVYTYGVAFVDEDIDFWNMAFPPWTAEEKEAARLPLECSSCKSRETLNHSEMELDVYAINQGIVRYCRNCGYSTVWKRTADTAEEKTVAPAPLQEARVAAPVSPMAAALAEPQEGAAVLTMPPPAEDAKETENRRKHTRVKVKVAACIRAPGSEDEMAVCEEMSRGGFCFRSRKRYTEGSTIEAAVPYANEASSIFVPAQIRHVEELPEQGLFRCGAVYLGNFKSS